MGEAFYQPLPDLKHCRDDQAFLHSNSAVQYNFLSVVGLWVPQAHVHQMEQLSDFILFSFRRDTCDWRLSHWIVSFQNQTVRSEQLYMETWLGENSLLKSLFDLLLWETNGSHLLAHAPGACNGQGWTVGMRPGDRNSIQVSHVDGRIPITWDITTASQRLH